MRKDIARLFIHSSVYSFAFFFYYPTIWDYVIIFLGKVSKIRIIVCAEAPLWRRKSAFRYRMKYHSVRGWMSFPKESSWRKRRSSRQRRWRKSEDCRWGYTREGSTLKLMIPREYPRRSTYHKSRVPRRRFFESHPQFSALFYVVHNSGVKYL